MSDHPARAATAEGTTLPFTTLAELVATLAARGARSAIVTFDRDGSTTLSYAELAEAIARTARGLHASGIARGDRVVLCGPNSAEWIVSYFGIVVAGAAAVPLDPQSASDHFAAAISHARPAAVITTRAGRAQLAPHADAGARFWLLDGADAGVPGIAELQANDGGDTLPPIASADLASLLFTSGTTGTPKAVPLTHGNLATNASGLLAARLVDADDRILLPLPLHHAYPFTAGLLMSLATNAVLLLPAGISGPEIREACTAGRATALLAVPRLCTALWDGIEAGVAARGALAMRIFAAMLAASIAVRRHTGLRIGRWLFRSVHERLGGALALVGCGGAKLPTELAWKLEGLGLRVLTGYGLTETSPVLTFNSPRRSRLGSEGQPLPEVELRIAGATSDTPGEILARGPSVFAGYWHNASATATAFTTDGWFRTGDLGALDERGYLHVVGRSKELIVLADGKKFFPEVVEKAYAACPSVREIGLFERDGLLAALVVPDEDEIRARGALREAAELRDEIEDAGMRLPPYQRITSYRVVRTPLPRTQLGKLRRHLLPGLFDAAANERPTAPPKLDKADRVLLATPLGRDVWRWLTERYPDRSLTLDTSPQFDLAIDSLAWVTLTVEIERRFDVALRAERLARILSLRDLLREIEAAVGTGEAPAPATARHIPAGSALRLLGAVLLAPARLVVRLLWRPTVTGVERLPAGPVLITPNHTSYLDPLVLAAALPWRRLRRTYWAGWVGVMHSTPLRRLVSRATQVFPVDPDRDLATAVRTAHELLAQGYDVVWFPEGRRSPTGELQAFRAGVGVLLQGAAAAVVPVAIAGTFAAWPKHRRWPQPARVRVAFGAPLEATAEREPAAVAALLEHAVADLLGATPPIAHPEHEPGRRHAMGTSSTTNTEATLRDGRRATIRPIRRDDLTRTASLIDGLSLPSKHALFLGGVAHLSDAALHRLCDPDDARDMAYVATVTDRAAAGGERQVGLCRYAGADSPEGAEISVAVADDWQHQGLGTLLLRHLIEHAHRHGVRRLYSMDAASNDNMRRLARELGFSEQRDPDDVHQVIYSLQP